MKAQLRVEIEAVNANVVRVYDAVIGQRENEANDTAHEKFGKRLDGHEVRLVALEKSGLPPS